MSALDLFDATPLRPEPQPPAIGMIVRLDRNIARQRPCHDNVVIIQPGKGPHIAELGCANVQRTSRMGSQGHVGLR
jgi:hypothetical protein